MTQADLIASVLRFALNSVLASLTLDPARDVEDLTNEREAAAAMLAALNPRDAIQAALAARAVTAHHAAMECFRRAALEGVPDALMTRLMASGMALSRMSVQMIKALEQRKGLARPGASVDPIAAVLAAEAAAGAARTGQQAAQHAGGGQHPMPSERPASGPGAAPSLNRQARRRAAKQAAQDARARDTQPGVASRHGMVAA